MDSFNKKIKEELTSFDSQIPAGMSWDEMSPGILEKMPRKKRRFLPFWIFSGVSIVALGLLLLFNYYTNTSESESNSTSIISLVNESNTRSNKISLIDKENTNEAEALELNKTENTIVEKDQVNLSDSKISSYDNVSNNLLTENKDLNNSSYSQPTNTFNFKQHTNTKENLTIKRSGDSPLVESSNLNGVNPFLSAVSTDERDISSIPSINPDFSIDRNVFTSKEKTGLLSLINMELLSKKKARVSAREMTIKPIETKKATKIKYSSKPYITVSAGAIFWNWGIRGTDEFNIDDYEKTLTSYGLKIDIDVPINKTFGWRTGIQYADLRTKLDHVFITESTHTDSTILGPVHNQLTGEVTYEGPAEIRVTENRKVIAYNHYRLIQIPVLLTARMVKNKWNIMAGAGVNVGGLIQARGKSIDSDLLFRDLEEEAGVASFIGLGVQGDLGVGYSISPSYAIELKSSYSQSMTNWTNSDLDYRAPKAWFIGLGLRKTL